LTVCHKLSFEHFWSLRLPYPSVDKKRPLII